MLNAVDSVASASHLTVSVFAHSATERLVGVALRTEEESKAALEDAIKVLKRVAEGKPGEVETTTGLRPFRDYDQLMILFEVLKVSALPEASKRLKEYIETLEKLRDRPGDLSKTDRKRTTRFFLDLAKEALYRSRRPPEGIPRAVRELCEKKQKS